MLNIYKAQSKNVSELATARKTLSRLLNDALIRRDGAQVRVLTKLLCVTFSCWAEARFSKLINTPYGFTETEIAAIRFNGTGAERPVEDRWKACISAALAKVQGSGNSSETPNCKQRLHRLLDRFVFHPSRLRNKIAHGQWDVALNSTHTAVNMDISEDLQLLDLLEVDLWFEVFERLAQVVEDIIESPEKAYRRDHWRYITEVEDLLDQRKTWTVETKREGLIRKKQQALAKYRQQLGLKKI
jgi:hypothetical protein